MLDGQKRSDGHDAEFLDHHIAGLLLPGFRVRRESGNVNEHVERFVPVGSGSLFDGALVEVIDLENPGPGLLQLEGVSSHTRASWQGLMLIWASYITKGRVFVGSGLRADSARHAP